MTASKHALARNVMTLSRVTTGLLQRTGGARAELNEPDPLEHKCMLHEEQRYRRHLLCAAGHLVGSPCHSKLALGEKRENLAARRTRTCPEVLTGPGPGIP